MMITILVVEDNDHLRRLMAVYLRRVGYNVLEACNGKVALAMIEASRVSIITLDLMMPVMDGFGVLKALRKRREHIPTLVISASETEADRHIALSLGADDYMVKPVEMMEVLARIDALLRRSSISQSHKLIVGNTTLCGDTMTTRHHGVVTQLAEKEFALLLLLLSHPGKIFTKQTLVDEVGGDCLNNDMDKVDMHIHRLQHIYETNEDFGIETVRGLGYRAVIR